MTALLTFMDSVLRVLRTYGRICPKGKILGSRGSTEAVLKSTHNLCFEFHVKIVIYRQKTPQCIMFDIMASRPPELSCVVRKPVIWVSDQTRHKPDTEDD